MRVKKNGTVFGTFAPPPRPTVLGAVLVAGGVAVPLILIVVVVGAMFG